MIRIAVVSGKGGTGKTMVAAALTDLLTVPKVLADCDVDAANLELFLDPRLLDEEPFMGLERASIDPAVCTGCGACASSCRFDAIACEEDRCAVDPLRCEGCGVCTLVCPAGAVHMTPFRAGTIYRSETAAGKLAHARLSPGAGNSGLLVHSVRQKAEEMAGESRVLLADGPPGIGCPLISTISGMDAVLAVTEPGISALHDLRRLVTVCRGFSLRIFVVINKFDLEPSVCRQVEDFCREEGLPVIGHIPFDPAVLAAVREGRPVTRTPSPASEALYQMAEHLSGELTIDG
ncbi:ATP-binding protein [Methanofollis sp. UBA420]|jgi:MinD superfamily P-loop ATPase|uniref:ATP-binding protein n=1 Tax=Methanofollis sp. UBA420 TaxID=1915514 RepID=UPI00316ACAF7